MCLLVGWKRPALKSDVLRWKRYYSALGAPVGFGQANPAKSLVTACTALPKDRTHWSQILIDHAKLPFLV
jgi:hypothetical protein